MRITLRLSESLLSIYRASEKEFDETIVLDLDGSMSIRQVLQHVGINPILTPLISIEGQTYGLDHILEDSSVITLIGPLAGG